MSGLLMLVLGIIVGGTIVGIGLSVDKLDGFRAGWKARSEHESQLWDLEHKLESCIAGRANQSKELADAIAECERLRGELNDDARKALVAAAVIQCDLLGERVRYEKGYKAFQQATGCASPEEAGKLISKLRAPAAKLTLEHGTNCPLSNPASDNFCTCGLVWRVKLQTEVEMHAAWRKRAEQSESELMEAGKLIADLREALGR